MERCKKLGHEVETCVVVEHLPRLSALQSRNGTAEENGDLSRETRKASDRKVTSKLSCQHSRKCIDFPYPMLVPLSHACSLIPCLFPYPMLVPFIPCLFPCPILV